jgi:tRNA(Ile)-lysidine synthase
MVDSHPFFKKFNVVHHQQDWYINRVSLLVAVSGGMDSMALLYVLHTLGFPVEVIHINFELRGEESENDESFLKNYSDFNNLILHLRHPEFYKNELKRQSGIQDYARKERYKQFENISKETGIEKICTAHHLDDQAETLTHRFIRGSGWRGFLGIEEENNKILRPFLKFTRQEIETLVIDRNIPYRTDSTNLTDKYTRNYIRHHILPSIEKLNPLWKIKIPGHLTILKDQWAFFEYSVATFWKPRIKYDHDYIYIDCKNLAEIPGSKSLLFSLLENLELQTGPSEDILADLKANKSGTIYPAGENFLLLYRSELVVKRFSNHEDDIDLPIHFYPSKLTDNPLIVPGGRLYLKNQVADHFDDCFPLNKKLFNSRLTIRRWKKGDLFKPAGMKGKTKKLSDFLTDNKIHRFKKERIILLSHSDEILWIPGYRQKHMEKNELESQLYMVFQAVIKPKIPLEIFGETI